MIVIQLSRNRWQFIFQGHFFYSRIPSIENSSFRLDFFSTGFSCLYRQSGRFYTFCALLRGGSCEGVLLYGSRKSVGSYVIRVFSASNACSRSRSPRPSELVAFGLAESRLSYLGGVAFSRESPKLHSAGVAVVSKMGSIPGSAAVV